MQDQTPTKQELDIQKHSKNLLNKPVMNEFPEVKGWLKNMDKRLH